MGYLLADEQKIALSSSVIDNPGHFIYNLEIIVFLSFVCMLYVLIEASEGKHRYLISNNL